MSSQGDVGRLDDGDDQDDVHRCAGDHRAPVDGAALLASMRAWAAELGFSQIGIADLDLAKASLGLRAWLQAGHHGTMDYMARHADLRACPQRLVPGAVRAVMVRMDYLPAGEDDGWREREWSRLHAPGESVVSVYARGRDYHKVMRARLARLAERLAGAVGPFGHRVFTDSAPVMEVELAAKSGLGWRGKHTLLLSREAGSTFFLGEIFIDFPLPLTPPVGDHCGECRACIDVCPTQAIVAAHRLDARRCIAYLTIEHAGPIPVELRRAIGNRVFGCDDCQLACPWNKFAQRAVLPDFEVREHGRRHTLLDFWAWDEATFLSRTQGTVLRRAGWERWRRNLAVAMGNAIAAKHDVQGHRAALRQGRPGASAMVGEHIDWALGQEACAAR